jgi:hypothetical protein
MDKEEPSVENNGKKYEKTNGISNGLTQNGKVMEDLVKETEPRKRTRRMSRTESELSEVSKTHTPVKNGNVHEHEPNGNSEPTVPKSGKKKSKSPAVKELAGDVSDDDRSVSSTGTARETRSTRSKAAAAKEPLESITEEKLNEDDTHSLRSSSRRKTASDNDESLRKNKK